MANLSGRLDLQLHQDVTKEQINGKRPVSTVLTYEEDYAASRTAGSIVAMFQGSNWSTRLIGCSAMCSKTKRR